MSSPIEGVKRLLKHLKHYEHKEGVAEGYTKKYTIKRLVYYEMFDDFEPAEQRERKLKRWRRQWKDERIESVTPD